MTIQDLIKTYPNDAELGAVVREMFSNNLPLDRVAYSAKDGFIEGNPIFAKLEDTTMKKSEDYEILSIKYGNEIFNADEYGIDKIIEGSYRFEGDGKWTIHSVKRLGDGTVFTIGDIVLFYGLGKFEITEITLTGHICHKEISRYILSVEHTLKVNEMKSSPLKKCIKCQTTVHVGIAKSEHCEDIIVCLSCLYDKKHRLFQKYNIWGVINEQRQIIK